jgi:hypothetical protein
MALFPFLLAAAISLAVITPAGDARAGPPSGGGVGAGELSPDLPGTAPRQELSFETVVVVEPTRPLGKARQPSQPRSGLNDILQRLDRPAKVMLQPGHYDLPSIFFEDPTCAPCDDPSAGASATVGLRVSGAKIEIIGASPESVFIHTNAGYGVLFDGCSNCAIRGVTITDGVRDGDPNASDAGIVVRESEVLIERCDVRDNVGDSTAVASGAGLGGIVAREGARIEVRNCRIVRNSSDGIALLQGARAEIRDNVIDGVDKAQGGESGGGRGIGIAIEEGARAKIEGNLVTRYENGIGVIGDARVEVHQNVIEDVALWGIACRDDAGGEPTATIRGNAVFMTGGCGALIAAREHAGRRSGSLSGNAFVMTARAVPDDAGDLECVPIVLDGGAPPGFKIGDNLFFGNRGPGGAPGANDLEEAAFRDQVRSLAERLQKHASLRASRFVRSYSSGKNF